MALELLAAGAYQTIQHSWAVATMALKYVLLIYVLNLAYNRELDSENFIETVEEYSKSTVTAILVLGFLFAVSGVRPEPMLAVLSELVALGYFALLFWRF